MPSTFTPSLKIELIGNGEQPTTWGDTTNNNMGTLIEQSIAGVQPITLTGNTVLSNFNGISDQARNAVLVFNGALSNTANVVAPSVEKTYIVSNRAGANVVIKTAAGNGISVSNNTNVLIYCDGAEFYTAVNPNNVIDNLSVSGSQTVAGSISIGGDITINNKISSNAGTLTLNSSTGVVDMVTNSGAFTPPTGTDGERPGSPDLGMTRWNSTQGILEIWNGVQWQNITGNYAVDYVIVAGGGGGGNFGGGGAGGLLANATTVAVGTAYTVTIGAGGSGGNNGSNTLALGFTSIGGGRGDSGNGGSGGGTTNTSGPGLGTAGQGNNGGIGPGASAVSGGGGGAGQVGFNGVFPNGGNGGDGVSSSITGTATFYAGGGGGNTGASNPTAQAQGGSGGGGKGRVEFGVLSTDSTPGSANTGGGGGGGNTLSGSGGSGVAIVRYASASQRGTGGTVTSYSDAGITYFVHTFNSSGTFTA